MCTKQVRLTLDILVSSSNKHFDDIWTIVYCSSRFLSRIARRHHSTFDKPSFSSNFASCVFLPFKSTFSGWPQEALTPFPPVRRHFRRGDAISAGGAPFPSRGAIFVMNGASCAKNTPF